MCVLPYVREIPRSLPELFLFFFFLVPTASSVFMPVPVPGGAEVSDAGAILTSDFWWIAVGLRSASASAAGMPTAVCLAVAFHRVDE